MKLLFAANDLLNAKSCVLRLCAKKPCWFVGSLQSFVVTVDMILKRLNVYGFVYGLFYAPVVITDIPWDNGTMCVYLNQTMHLELLAVP